MAVQQEDEKEFLEEKDPEETEESSLMKWYIAKTKSGQENKVIKSLHERIANHNLQEFFSEIMSPEETVVMSIGRKKKSVKKKFFPGYLLIKMEMNDRTWHLVQDTDKITDL